MAIIFCFGAFCLHNVPVQDILKQSALTRKCVGSCFFLENIQPRDEGCSGGLNFFFFFTILAV